MICTLSSAYWQQASKLSSPCGATSFSAHYKWAVIIIIIVRIVSPLFVFVLLFAASTLKCHLYFTTLSCSFTGGTIVTFSKCLQIQVKLSLLQGVHLVEAFYHLRNLTYLSNWFSDYQIQWLTSWAMLTYCVKTFQLLKYV